MEAGTLAIARPVASPLHRYWRTFVFAALFIVLWFGFLEVRGLYFPDEGRYAEIPREMLATGDWITPRVNEFPYFEKPPLQYWMTAAMFAVAGEDEWTARFPAALAGLVGILAVLATARRLYGRRAGWMAGAVLASFCGFFLGGQFLTLDMLLTTLLTCALCAFVLAQDARATAKDRRQWMLVAWALCGLAFLTKGAIAVVLPGLALVVYVALSRDLGLVRRLHLLPGLAVFAAITMPWFIAVELRNPGFNEFFFVHEHWQRFTQPVHRRTGPLWYFIPIAIVFLLPWLPAIVVMLAKRSVVRARSAGFDAQRFAWCWAATIFVFFSLSSSKLPAYIMPALGAVALAAAPLLARRWKASLSISGWTLIACGIFAAAATVAAPAWIKVPDVLATFESNRGWLFAAAAALAGTGVAGAGLAATAAARSRVGRPGAGRHARVPGRRRPGPQDRHLFLGGAPDREPDGRGIARPVPARRALLQRGHVRPHGTVLPRPNRHPGEGEGRARVRDRRRTRQLHCRDRNVRRPLARRRPSLRDHASRDFRDAARRGFAHARRWPRRPAGGGVASVPGQVSRHFLAVVVKLADGEGAGRGRHFPDSLHAATHFVVALLHRQLEIEDGPAAQRRRQSTAR
jgi:4-amino-4-deoxy-L-arabinose transferase-like glycosyltransferase